MAFRTVIRSNVLVGCIRGFSAVPYSHHTFSGVGKTFSFGVGAKGTYLRTQIFSSSFSTATPTNADPASQLGYEDVQALFERDHFVKLKKRLEKDDRRRMSVKEYTTLASEEGLTEEQATRLLKALNDAGFLLHFSNSTNTKLQGTIFLKPQELNSSIHHVLEQYSPSALKHHAEVVQTEIKDLTHQLEPLKQQRDVLEHKANRRANVLIGAGLGYCVLQFLAIGRLTWWELSWDVMEPVTYMLTFATALIGYSFFVLTGSEYTFEGLKKTLRERRLKKLIKRTGFDEGKFKQLHLTLSSKEHALHKILEEIAHNGPLHTTPHHHNPALAPGATNAAAAAAESAPKQEKKPATA